MNEDLKEALEYIDPRDCDYLTWAQVGMAIKESGYDVSLWDDWSSRDNDRYHEGECYKKWNTFTSSGITAKTIFKLAIDNGYQPPRKFIGENKALEFDSVISDNIIVDKSWLEREVVEEPTLENWNQKSDIERYIQALFKPHEKVGYVIQAYQDKDDKWKPNGVGAYARTASQLLAEMEKHQSINDTFGDYNQNAGVWIRFNPLDGNGVKNSNVTDYRYTLVESDNLEIGMQLSIIRKLELPCAAIVYSGGKSVHAIVHIDAGSDLEEYKKRVERLYSICNKNGLKVDQQNKNPSRLSRMPGFIRGEHKQFLIDTDCGQADWNSWDEWIDQQTDDLPDPETLDTVWNNLPPLAPELIHGVLRQGHKMMIAGPSKAGKSFALIELTIAIAEGIEWLGMKCEQGKVMYINLELDTPSCLNRFKDVYKNLGIQNPNGKNISIWNLRGKSTPMDKLAPKLIRRAQKDNYMAIIIDPIYKVITGDENSAEQMAKFTNQFDKVATELNCAVIYCHHHSKGSQAGKRSMDRASGSGVFARDPDALLDIIELTATDDILATRKDKAIIKCYKKLMAEYDPWTPITKDDLSDVRSMANKCKPILLKKMSERSLEEEIENAKLSSTQDTCWRVDYTLREFAKPKPLDLWFSYPVHEMDTDGVLSSLVPEADMTPQERARSHIKSPEEKKSERQAKLELAFANVERQFGEVTTGRLEEHLGLSKRTLINWMNESNGRFSKQKIEGKNEYKIILNEVENED